MLSSKRKTKQHTRNSKIGLDSFFFAPSLMCNFQLLKMRFGPQMMFSEGHELLFSVFWMAACFCFSARHLREGRAPDLSVSFPRLRSSHSTEESLDLFRRRTGL